MKTRNKWTIVFLVLIVVAFVGWFVGSFTFTKSLSRTIALEVFLYDDQDVEQILSAASATVHRLGYKTTSTNFTYSSTSDDKSSMGLKAQHEDGTVVEIRVDAKTDGRPRLWINLTQNLEVSSRDDDANIGTALEEFVDGLDALPERASRILEAIKASLESP